MPIYEYRCEACGEQFDQLVRSISQQSTVTCPNCGSEETKKAISLFGVSSASHSSKAADCSTGSV